MDISPLTIRLIEQLAESNDDLGVLENMADRLESHAPKLMHAWLNAEGRASEANSEANTRYSGLIHQLLAFLRADDLRALYSWIAVQGESLAVRGIEYDQVWRLCEAHHRAAIPVLAQAYEPGAELELALAALENAYNAGMLILGAAYLQMAQERIVPGLRLQTVGRLASGMTHSLNNLLTVIVGRAQILRYTLRDENAKRELEEIQNAALVAAQTIRQLQDFAQAVREEELVETDVNLAIEEAIELTRFRWRDEAERNGHLINVARDLVDVPRARAKPGLVREIFVEIIFDAIAALRRGGVIGFRTERVGEQILVAVSHTGEAPVDTEGGAEEDAFAGIGLAQARSLLASLGGTLEVIQSGTPEDRSSVVNVLLPIMEATNVEPEVPGNRDLSGLSILVIEDELPIRGAIGQILARQGHYVVEAESGADGKRQVTENDPFDVILTDLGMAGVSSWEITELAKRKSPHTLVVLMTGWTAELDPEKLRASGIARVLQKPFSEKQLLDVINEARELAEKI